MLMARGTAGPRRYGVRDALGVLPAHARPEAAAGAGAGKLGAFC